MSLIGKALSLRNAGKAPIPLGDGVSAARRGLSFNLGAGRADAETHMRQYGMSGTIYGIVSLLAESAATPEWHLYKKAPVDGRRRYSTADQGSDQRVEVVQHAAIQLINNPNDFHSRFEFFEGSQQHEELTGETFWVLDTEAGFPTSMWYVRPDRMQPVPDADDYLLGWVYTGPTGEQVPLKTGEVILEKRPDPLDPYRGAGPVASILPNIQQQRYATEYQRNLFLNGADPGGIITVPNRLSEPEFDDLVDRWRESHRGVARAGQVGVLENGAMWTPNAHTNKDMEYGELRLANRDELREAWRIHKVMMGTSDDVNRASAQTGEEIFVAWQVLPRLNRRRDTMNCKLLPLFARADKTVEFDYQDPSPTNAETAANELLQKAQAAQALVAAGYSARDVLEAVGLPDMDVADIPAAAAAPAPDAQLGDDGQNRARPQITMRRLPALTATATPTAPPHDLTHLDEQWKRAVDTALTAYLAQVVPDQRKQIDDQITELVDDGDIAGLAALTIDSAAGAALLATVMSALASASADAAAAEAKQQGATGVQPTVPPKSDFDDVAASVAALAAAGLALSAGHQAARLALAMPDATGAEIAERVGEHLDGLSESSLKTRISGAMSSAQNTARINTFLSGEAADLFASEILDNATCDPCREIDSTFIGNSADPDIEAKVDALYPNGPYTLCLGEDRCRGTVIASYAGPIKRQLSARAAADAAAKVFAQVAEDFPPAATGWMHHATWSGPVPVPLAHVDWEPSGMDGKDPDRVAAFAAKLQAGKKLKPVVLVKTPGNDRLGLIDGHHRFLAAAELDEPVRAFIGVVGEDHGPWETMHDLQYASHNNKARPAIGAAATLSKAQVRYRDAVQMDHRCGTCAMFRSPDACTLVKGVIEASGVCDRWAARAEAGNKLSPAEAVDLARRIQSDGWTPVQIGGRY